MPDINHTGPDLISELEDCPPFHQAPVGAITHLLVTFVPMVTPALIVGVALQLSVEATVYLVPMAMIVSGISTWLRMSRYGIVGSGLFPIQSVNSSFVTTMITLGSSMKSDGFHEELIMSSLLDVSFVGALLAVGSSSILPYSRRVVTPTIGSIVVLIIDLSPIKVGIIDFGGGFVAKSSGTFGNYERLGVGLLALTVAIGFNYCRSPLLRMGGIATELYVGHTVSSCPGMTDFNSMHNLPLITAPYSFKYGFSLSFCQFLVVGTICLLSMLEAVGDVIATAIVPHRPTQGEEYQFRLRGGVPTGDLIPVITPAVDSLPLTTFAQNNGVIQMISVASRYVGQAIAIMLITLGLFPMIGSFFTIIPSAASRGVMTLVFSMIAITGIHIIITDGLKHRETLITATSSGSGPGISYDPEIFRILPASICVLVENSTCAGGLTATLSNTILPGGYRRESVLPGITSAEKMD